ncbi:hypothetical protein BABINDRAFT_162026 [Babjeviella inositovora NRRL Y-12698]|uniref:RING-type domain-containing protein n=1 Tax=Babjeviella inositovora NRRL Y-12698 TaxID=984486 RepID=A0A1E3QPM1_9ASCO|nr:uncharacterized protein BABINDRAFT_162026 [Babjeviella inositovora NRRL Y-12698]ODQ79653.1 hypothetical protein BABINDRAFT_162026 [Babjeviella inositovora NRRL Y-12698]
MKFAKLFEQTLREESIPEEWIQSSIKYKQLKKCINKVVDELNDLGLEKSVLSTLIQQKMGDDGVPKIEELDDGVPRATAAKPSAKYLLDKDLKNLRPVLTIDVSALSQTQENGKIEGTGDSQYVQEALQRLVEQRELSLSPCTSTSDSDNERLIDGITTVTLSENPSPLMYKETSPEPVPSDGFSSDTTLVFRLKSDGEFFHMLSTELQDLDTLKIRQESQMFSTVQQVGDVINKYSAPSTRRSDMYAWRNIFCAYIESEVFFRNNISGTSDKDVQKSKENFQKFLGILEKGKYYDLFKNKQSTKALNEFIGLNYLLLKLLQFQHINRMAITKILKKFDKQTSLTAKTQFPELISTDPFIKESFAKTMCAIISNKLLTIVPQLDDYECPICTSIAFKPIKLSCGHLFCIRCLVKLQRANKESCPLCRERNVLDADSANMDADALKYMQLYFPKEVKAKQKETESEIAREQFVAVYGEPKKCLVQ